MAALTFAPRCSKVQLIALFASLNDGRNGRTGSCVCSLTEQRALDAQRGSMKLAIVENSLRSHATDIFYRRSHAMRESSPTRKRTETEHSSGITTERLFFVCSSYHSILVNTTTALIRTYMTASGNDRCCGKNILVRSSSFRFPCSPRMSPRQRARSFPIRSP